jgi:hypothetical protein
LSVLQGEFHAGAIRWASGGWRSVLAGAACRCPGRMRQGQG